MADPQRAHRRNVPGELFVDTTCIDCDTCGRLAGSVFASEGAGSFVTSQPGDERARQRALMALLSCPVGAIGTRAPDPQALRQAMVALPDPVAPGVYDCGYASPDSYGASSWLVVRPEGNLLVDSPRAAGPLLKRLDALGGVSTLFLTHRDDVADHAKLRARYGCARVIHERDAQFDVERLLSGDEPTPLAPDLLAVPVPGHTRGSAALLWGEILFTGDHLWGDGAGALSASRSVCWWSWPAQIRSMERLRELSFSWVLPGHGLPLRAESPQQMRGLLDELIVRMRATR
jgi:glyoxylase-like metal-dependent hydrolase (beta-lactamase superfamily II)/ferredoxin